AAIAMTHLILAAENEGVGACWIANYDPEILKEALRSTLGAGENEVIFGITPLGYPMPGFSKSGIKRRKELSEVVEYL
ncbi:nitroreductase, partial [bacterium]|nr:nitroreductase [bacterium]